MPNRRVPGPESVESLLARTKRQITRTIFAATALVVLVVGAGGALAGSNALDAGLDRALVIRAEKIVHELQEVMPPLASAPPSPGASAEPSESAEPGKSAEPNAEPSTDPSESAEPEESDEPSADPTLPPGGDDEDDEGDDGEEAEPYEAYQKVTVPLAPGCALTSAYFFEGQMIFFSQLKNRIHALIKYLFWILVKEIVSRASVNDVFIGKLKCGSQY